LKKFKHFSNHLNSGSLKDQPLVVLRVVPSDYVLATILSVLSFLVIRKISAAIALLYGVTPVLAVYLYVSVF
jgi:hypothetical protein